MSEFGLTNRYLEELLFPRTKYFKGVFSCDNIPIYPIRKPFTIIVNLSHENEMGSHFISIFIARKKVIYFDSLGLPCINPHIKNYLRYYSSRNGRVKTVQNEMQFQCLNSFFCGYYCALFVLLMERGMTFKRFLNLFSKHCNENDSVVIDLLKYIFTLL